MSDSAIENYTAKFIDGPLEGKTISTAFLESGDPQPRLEIPSADPDKRYLYVHAGGLEFEADSSQPTAVNYRYLQAVFS